MLNCGKKFRALRNKKINILILVLSEKKILNETISSGYLPNSPYTIKLVVDTFRRNKSLQNFKWTLSIISFLPNPQISHPYNKIGFTILSNKFNWHLIDKLCILPFLNTSYMAVIPLFTSSFFAILNDPVFENTIPR